MLRHVERSGDNQGAKDRDLGQGKAAKHADLDAKHADQRVKHAVVVSGAQGKAGN